MKGASRVTCRSLNNLVWKLSNMHVTGQLCPVDVANCETRHWYAIGSVALRQLTGLECSCASRRDRLRSCAGLDSADGSSQPMVALHCERRRLFSTSDNSTPVIRLVRVLAEKRLRKSAENADWAGAAHQQQTCCLAIRLPTRRTKLY